MKTLRASLLSACLLMGLSGCGFAPLYAETGVTSNLSKIALTLPDTRTGYFVEQELRTGLQSDEATAKAYDLEITLKENHYSIGFRADDTATRSEMNNRVTYTLRDRLTGKVILRGNFDEVVTYNASKSPYADVVSQQDAQKRSATMIAKRIQSDLAVFFNGRT